MAVEVLVAPAGEPVALAQMKAALRVTAPEDDATILDAIRSARAKVEAGSNLVLTTRTLRLTLNGFPPGPVVLPVWPVQSIAEVSYVDAAGATAILDPVEWTLIKSCKPRLLAPAFGKTWPATRVHYDAVRIDIVAGYGTTATDLPADILAAVMRLAGHYYEHREAVAPATLAALPLGVEATIREHAFLAPACA